MMKLRDRTGYGGRRLELKKSPAKRSAVAARWGSCATSDNDGPSQMRGPACAAKAYGAIVEVVVTRGENS
jgi:hypothetical protein